MVRYQVPLVASLFLVATPAFAQMPPTVVRAVAAQTQSVEPHHRFTGSLRAVARGDVAALEDGRVLEVTVREGATVKKGDIVARIDDRRLKAQQGELDASLHTAQALIAQREAELRQANLDMERASTLIRNNAISQQLYDRSETQVAVAQAQLETDRRRLEEIKQQLKLIQVRLDDTVVRAPYDAQVIQRHTEAGEWIRAGEPFVTLVSTGQIEAWLEIPERFAGIVAEYAEAVEVQVAGCEDCFTSLAVKQVHEVHPRTRTFSLVLTLETQDAHISPGMSVEAWLPIGPKENSLTVPKNAVIRSAGTAYVFKAVSAEDQVTALRVPIKVKFETGNLAVVQSAQLSDGELVVVEGNERLFPGMPIAIAPDTSPGGQQTAAKLHSPHES